MRVLTTVVGGVSSHDSPSPLDRGGQQYPDLSCTMVLQPVAQEMGVVSVCEGGGHLQTSQCWPEL